MPKEGRRRTRLHDKAAARLATRSFAVSGSSNAIEKILPGSDPSAPVETILNPEPEPPTKLKKKDKKQLKHDAFIEKLELGRSPYSKSHTRRMKRKEKEQLATGMDEIGEALSAVAKMAGASEESNTIQSPTLVSSTTQTSRTKLGQIGEGKGVTLTESQRRRALHAERIRQPLILTNPEFAKNPFQTIRTHAQNTLLKHEVPVKNA